jgi:NAD-specific glutamate dehydrogenase
MGYYDEQTVISAPVSCRSLHEASCSNNFFADEILLSSDKTIAIIDGSGVLADSVGLNREELVRLAKLRVPVSNFDLSKLSKEGYLVKVEDQDVKLPCQLQLVSLC